MESPATAFGSYEELVQADRVDGIYIPLPTGLRKEWVIRAANAGKHVVCEKPCAVTTADLKEMIEACRKNRVQFMDGVMFMHSRRLHAIRDVIQSGAIGKIRRIDSAFTFCGPPEFLTENIRMHSGLEPHGCVGDLGWYCVRFALWLLNWKMPQQISGKILAQLGRSDSPSPVPTQFSGELVFEDEISAGFYCSFVTGLQQWVIVSGTEGSLSLDDFVLPTFSHELGFEVRKSRLNIQGCDFNAEASRQRYSIAEYSNSHVSSQETNLFRNFVEQVRSGNLNESWPEMALKTQQIIESCLEAARRAR